jgi:ABC-type polysaccharide/polyol phosphate transport system ATPase subunit
MASILIRGLSFSYPLVNHQLKGRNGLTRYEIPVFSDLSLEVRDGARLAIVGPNGAGKTTLLKLIAGILPAAEGAIRVEGIVSPLLNIRLGMEAEFTGIENIWLRGVYMGKTRHEIEERLPGIVEFTELGEFIDLPVNTYSRGMVARLAFAIATSFDPDILLIDESIAAGDKRFAKKAVARLREFVDGSSILVLATHNEWLMKRMCNRVLDLGTGEISALGGTRRS